MKPTHRPALRQLLACCILAAAPYAQATPDQTADAVLTLLQERGVVAATSAIQSVQGVQAVQNVQAIHSEAQALVRHVRDSASGLVISAMNFLGVKYRRGGNTPEQGFDCSGFTRHIFEHTVGLVLPRRADQQAQDDTLQSVAKDQLEPGDLVFFNTMRRAFSHVGIYVGDGKFIHAPRTGGKVRVEDMREAYWAKRYNGARRAELEPRAAAESKPAGTGG